MKVFVTGVAGQLGHDVMNELHTILTKPAQRYTTKSAVLPKTS